MVILAGEARRCYHGVPRVMERFEDLKSCDGKGVKVNKRSLSSSTYLGASIENDGDSSGNSKEGGDKADGEGNELRLIRGAIGAHLRGTRINISIRGEGDTMNLSSVSRLVYYPYNLPTILFFLDVS